MASVIKSVEKVTLTLSSGSNPVSTNLSKGQTYTACVPFFTTREAGAAVTDSFSNRLVEVWFDNNAGTARVNAQLNAGDDVQVEIFVVEWDTTKVNVQQGTFTVASSAATGTATISDIDQAKAFIVFNLRGTSALGDAYQGNEFDAFFSSDTQITVQRHFGVASSFTGRYYIVECIGSEFSVQVANPTMTLNQTTSDDTISSVDTTKTFLVGGYRCQDATDDQLDNAVWFHLQSATAVRLARSGGGTPAGVISASTIFAVTCANDEWTVERFQPTIGAAETADDTTITSIDQTRAILIPGTGMGHTMPHMNTTTGASTGLVGLTFAANDTARASRRATTTAGYYAFEVVQFAQPVSNVDIAATLTGQGSLTSGAQKTAAAAASLTGQGSLVAGATASRAIAASLTGQGFLAADADVVIPAIDIAATLTGQGSLLAGASAYRGVDAALTGQGSLQAGATALRAGAAIFSGSGLLTLGATALRSAAVTLEGVGTLTAGASAARSVAAVLEGQAVLTAGPTAFLAAAATFEGQGVLTAAAESAGDLFIAATLTGQGSLDAAPVGIWAVSVSLAGSSLLEPGAVALRSAGAGLTGEGRLQAGPSVSRAVAASLAGQATLEADARVARPVAAALTGGSTLIAGAEVLVEGIDIAAVLTGQSSLDAFARLVLNASIRLEGGSSLSADASEAARNPTRLRTRRPQGALITALPPAALTTRTRSDRESPEPARAMRTRLPDTTH